MIIDKISNARKYTSLVKGLSAALAKIDGNYNLDEGRYDFDGGWIVSTSGTSRPLSEKQFESHVDYADVMFVLDGEETVSYAPTEVLKETQSYNPANDYALYDGDNKDIIVTIPAGYFYIVMPGEGHKPTIHTEKAKPFRKYILKCRQTK